MIVVVVIVFSVIIISLNFEYHLCVKGFKIHKRNFEFKTVTIVYGTQQRELNHPNEYSKNSYTDGYEL